MRKDIAEKWASLLESGAHPQCMASLKVYGAKPEEDSFCALGVLCELHRTETGGEDWQIWQGCRGPTGPCLVGEYMGEGGFLPQAVREWAGMHDGRGLSSVERRSVATLNDGGTDFITIAKFIRKNWQNL